MHFSPTVQVGILRLWRSVFFIPPASKIPSLLCLLLVSAVFLAEPAAAVCGVDQTIRLGTDIGWCMKYPGPAHDVLNAQDTMVAGVRAGNEGMVISGFHDCQIGQPNGQNNIDNGLDCEKVYPGIYIANACGYVDGGDHCPKKIKPKMKMYTK